jgi:competence protein ComEA
MRRPGTHTIPRLLALCSLTAGAACVEAPRTPPPGVEARAAQAQTEGPGAARRVNINTATREELERLPGIGEALAERIVEHRERYGPFRRTEHLLVVRGISESRFEQLRALVTVE